MGNDESTHDSGTRARSEKSLRWRRLFLIALMATAAFAAVAVGIPWLIALTPRWLVRGGSIVFLWTLFAAVIVGVPAVVIGGFWSTISAARAWKNRDRVALRRSLQRLLLAVTCLVGLSAAEIVASAKVRWSQRIPALPTRFAPMASASAPAIRPAQEVIHNDRRPGNADAPAANTAAGAGLYIVVVGESSARGEPYHPWLSVGQIVAWQLERVFPGRPIQIDVRAAGGLCLEQAVLRISDIERRPDAIIVFAGHNEFQARYGWSRGVRHYIDEGPESRLALLDLARSSTATTRLILSTLDLYHAEAPPPPKVTRELIDHPSCAPHEYAFLREEFQMRLDALTAYCEEIGSLPILIMPGSNDGSFEPSRSVLAGATPPDARQAFEREFLAARAAEPGDARAALEAYRRLAVEHPEFAETHYRIGRLLAAEGSWDAAKPEFVLARDLDGLPLRCPTDFREIYRVVAGRHRAVLIDGPAVLARLSPHGYLDDYLYHDAQHLNLKGTVALANEVIASLRQRRAFGWPEATELPAVELVECARHFGIDVQKWAEICSRTQGFYERTAYTRYEPTERLEIARLNEQAAADFGARRPVRNTTVPSIALAASILSQTQAAGGAPASRAAVTPGAQPTARLISPGTRPDSTHPERVLAPQAIGSSTVEFSR